MHHNQYELDKTLLLTAFSIILQKEPGLAAIRDLSAGQFIYINDAAAGIIGTTDPEELQHVLNLNRLGNDAPVAEAPGMTRHLRAWKDSQGKTRLSIYERCYFTHEGKDYCFFRLEAPLSNTSFEVKLSTELARFSALFDYASISILVVDRRGAIVMINDFALEQFGYARLELLGKPVETLIPARVRQQHVAHRERFHAAPQNRPMGTGLDLYAIKKDGTEFPVEISLSHYENEEGAFVIAYVNDITERRKVREKIERLNSELEQMVEERTLQLRKALQDLRDSRDELAVALGKSKELNELKSRFVSMASHEFRTPLSTIVSSAFLVQRYHEDVDKSNRDKHLQRIVSSANLLTNILNEFLSVGKIEEGKVEVRPAWFDISQRIHSIIQEVQETMKPGQEVDFRHDGHPDAYLDPSLFRHVFINLLTNAIKFSPAHSKIETRTYADGAQFTISVADRGIGITPEDQEHLFERFFRGSNVSTIQGTGLGLHIVSKYTEMMNGTISCESKLGEGTVFTLHFLLAEEPPAAGRQPVD